MKNKVMMSVFRYLLSVIVSVALLIAIKISMDGMYLLGIPKIDDVKQIRVSYPSVTEEIKEYDNSEKIDLAVKLTGFLKYSLFKQADDTENPLITIVYVLENGKEIEVSANNDTVWWNGKAHDIKDKEAFIKLSKGIFFTEDLVNVDSRALSPCVKVNDIVYKDTGYISSIIGCGNIGNHSRNE